MHERSVLATYVLHNYKEIIMVCKTVSLPGEDERISQLRDD